jgi:ABC-type uncharacterized transport system involved in gliding motility auxiliary subunit
VTVVKPIAPRATLRATSKAALIAGALLAAAALFCASYYPGQRLALWLAAAAGACCLSYFLVAERRLLLRAPASRAARHGTNAAAMTLAFLGILVLLNVLAVRHNRKWDATAERAFTLSSQTEKILDGLTTPVTVTAFFPEGTEGREQIKGLLGQYADRAPGLKVSFVDPDRSPELARQLGVRDYGTTVFASGDQTFRTTQATEEALTNALVRVTRKGKKTVYFLSGHQEHSPEDTQRIGYSTAKKALEEQGFAARELLLLKEAAVPADCAVLVVAGPAKPLLEQELAALKTYLDRGGRVLLLLDPMTTTGLEPLLAAWGVELRGDVVIDTMSRLFGGSYTTPILTEYPPHDISRDFRVPVFLPLARSVEAAKVLPEGITFSAIARTSPQSWGETNLKEDRAEFDADRDLKGPLTAAGLFEKKEVFATKDASANAQLLVVGDSDFADNTYYGFSGNGDLFQNMVSYLAKEEDLIAVRAKDAKPSPLSLSRAQAATLFYASVVAAPLTLMLAGLAIWWKRKNL